MLQDGWLRWGGHMAPPGLHASGRLWSMAVTDGTAQQACRPVPQRPTQFRPFKASVMLVTVMYWSCEKPQTRQADVRSIYQSPTLSTRAWAEASLRNSGHVAVAHRRGSVRVHVDQCPPTVAVVRQRTGRAPSATRVQRMNSVNCCTYRAGAQADKTCA